MCKPKIFTISPLVVIFSITLLLVACGGDGASDPEALTSPEGGILLTELHGGEGAAWGLPKCDACHSLEVIHDREKDIQGIVRLKGFGSCTGCHGRNGTPESAPRQCKLCHNEVDLPSPRWIFGQHGHSFSVQQPEALRDEHCLSCHVASDMNGTFELNRDLTGYEDESQLLRSYTSLTDFCLRCHNRDHQQVGFDIIAEHFDDPLVAIEDAFKFVDKHGLVNGTGERIYSGLRQGYAYSSVVECTDCHAMHGTNNEKLIIDDPRKGVAQLDESIRESISRVSVSDGGYAQLCVLCHQMTQISDAGDHDAGNGLSGVHEVDSDCRLCHTHGEAVQAGL